jgi:hypothetical protein
VPHWACDGCGQRECLPGESLCSICIKFPDYVRGVILGDVRDTLEMLSELRTRTTLPLELALNWIDSRRRFR